MIKAATSSSTGAEAVIPWDFLGWFLGECWNIHTCLVWDRYFGYVSISYDMSDVVLLVEKSNTICNSSILGMQEFNPGFKDVGDFHWFAAQKTWVLWILLGHCQAEVMWLKRLVSRKVFRCYVVFILGFPVFFSSKSLCHERFGDIVSCSFECGEKLMSQFGASCLRTVSNLVLMLFVNFFAGIDLFRGLGGGTRHEMFLQRRKPRSKRRCA